MIRHVRRAIGAPRFRLGALLVVMVIAALVITTQVIRASGGSNPPSLPPQRPAGLIRATGTPVYRGPIGIPAIQPRASLANAAGPHFTEADVRAYIAAHGSDFAVPGTPKPTVVSVEFLLEKQVSAQLQEKSMGITDNTLLCLARLSGKFLPYSVPSDAKHVSPSNTATLIFDAHTGNLLTVVDG